MADAIIGHTGFVGGNLARQAGFDFSYNSSNISDIKGKKFGTLVCAGARAEKWLINADPASDIMNLNALIDCLREVSAERLVLISTVDVYDRTAGVDEETPVFPERSEPYGRNRYYLEHFARGNFDNCLIVRLPALFGRGLKKNFIYDLSHTAPKIIMKAKFEELCSKCDSDDEAAVLKANYRQGPDLNYKFDPEAGKDETEKLSDGKTARLENILKKLGFTSLSFTHKDSRFQFYGLDNLWADIKKALEHGLKLINFATEPIAAAELARECLGFEFDNITPKPPFNYDMKTIHAHLYGGSKGYMYEKREVIEQVKLYFKNSGSIFRKFL